MAVSPELFVVLALSISCGVLGAFLLVHRGVRMLRGGLLHRLSVGLAAIGIALSVAAVVRLFGWGEAISDGLLIAALVVLFYIGYSAWLSAHEMATQA